MSLKVLIIFALIAQCLCNVTWIGTGKDANWFKHHDALVAQTVAHKSEIQVVFLGDSITQGWGGYGKDVWKKYYTPRHAYNYGIGGDRTENVIYRVDSKEFDGIKPKVVILKIGTNNMGDNSASEIAIGIYEIIRQLEAKLPTTKILLLAIIPKKGSRELKIQETNKIIAKFEDKKKVFYLDMSDKFQTAPGVEIEGLYVDGTHLTAKGYQVWAETMEPLLKQILA